MGGLGWGDVCVFYGSLNKGSALASCSMKKTPRVAKLSLNRLLASSSLLAAII